MSPCPPPAVEPSTDWPAARLFELLRDLSPLRVISVCGPSTFEAICDFDTHAMAHGYMNAIQPAYHWHFRLDGLRTVRSRDELHERSGRRVLFLEFRDDAQADPFLWIYVHRERGAEFHAEREKAFLDAHETLSRGIEFQGDPS